MSDPFVVELHRQLPPGVLMLAVVDDREDIRAAGSRQLQLSRPRQVAAVRLDVPALSFDECALDEH